MSFLFQVLKQKVNEWRNEDFAHEDFPAISEILGFAVENDILKYLRKAQLEALETDWYLRIKLDTPDIPTLYKQLFPKTKDKLYAMGISSQLYEEANYDFDTLVKQITTDNAFVRKHKLESLRETFTLQYPSYILALAMGAGKTILMGTIAATEFAMAQEYPEPDSPFVKNALIFAPGKTIIESLREIADIPFHKILPARMCKPFEATLKLTFTRDGEKELPVIRGSEWNIIVTNTEKIRIQKNSRRKKNQNQTD